MNERERVFELVRQGIITTEEALILLENMANENNYKKENTTQYSQPSQFEDNTEEQADEELDEQAERLEKIYRELADQANLLSSELDELNERRSQLMTTLKELKEQVMILDTVEELDSLPVEKQNERNALKQQIADLEIEKMQLEEDRADLNAKLKDLEKERRTTSNEQWRKKFEIPEDWEDNLNDLGEKIGEAGNQFGKKMGEAGTQLGRLLKDTFKTVSQTVNDNFEWKDVNFKVPGVSSSTFDHEFYYPNIQATLIDLKIANGDVTLSTWDSSDLKISATIKLYGKMTQATPLEAFLERSSIDVDNERISFQVPNKRIRVKLHIYLPNHLYDHVAIKFLNGDVAIEDMDVKDIFVKTTNGNMSFENMTATMLEIAGVNGDVAVKHSKIKDCIAETVNGDFSIQSAVENLTISSVDGDVKITNDDYLLKNITTKIVNGSIKVSLPNGIGLSGVAKTGVGSIKHRLANLQVINEKQDKVNSCLAFERLQGESIAKLALSVTTGSIYLKEQERSQSETEEQEVGDTSSQVLSTDSVDSTPIDEQV